jgi:hypothetical protein
MSEDREGKVRAFIQEMTAKFLEELRRDVPTWRADAHAKREQFESDLQATWGEAFEKYDDCLIAATVTGKMYIDQYSPLV